MMTVAEMLRRIAADRPDTGALVCVQLPSTEVALVAGACVDEEGDLVLTLGDLT